MWGQGSCGLEGQRERGGQRPTRAKRSQAVGRGGAFGKRAQHRASRGVARDGPSCRRGPPFPEGRGEGGGRNGLDLSPPPLLSFTGQLPLGRCPSVAAPCKGTSLFMQLVGIGNSPPSPQGKGSRRPPLCAGGRWTGRVPATLVHRGAPSPGAGRDRLNAFRLCWCAGVPYPTAPEGRERDASRPSLVRRGGGGESCPTEAAEERAASLFYWHREKKAGGAFTADAKRREAGSNLPRQREKQRDGPWPTDGWGRRGKRQFYPPSWKRGERHPHRHGGKTGGGLPCRHKAEPRADKPPLARQKKRGVCVPPRRHRETGRAANRPHRRREKRG